MRIVVSSRDSVELHPVTGLRQRARAGVDNQLLPIRCLRIAERHPLIHVAIVLPEHHIALKLLELIPGRFFVGDVHTPLDGADTLADGDLDRLLPCLMAIDAEAGRLAFNLPTVFELRDGLFVTLVITLGGQPAHLGGLKVPGVGRVADPGKADGRMNAIGVFTVAHRASCMW